MGQNFSGWAKIKITAPRDTIITLKFAERLFDNGMIDPSTTGPAATKVVQTDTYICKGKDEEIWEPRFTYHGFRYVEMTGLPGEPTLDNIEGIVVHTAVESSGKFICSDEMINKIQKTALWTELTNLHGIPTDCPHRERCGWLGDALITAEMTIYNFDMALFWAKFLEDINTTRRGELPQNIAPGKRLCGAKPDWQMAYILVPWFLYLYYGDKRILEQHYVGMKQLMDHLESISENHIVPDGFGDWCEPGNILFPENTDPLITTTAFYFYSAKIMSRIAEIMEDKNQDYDQLATKIKPAFIKKFYNKKKKTFGSQCADSIALKFNLVPEGGEQTIADSLSKNIMEKYNCHFSTGIFGIRYLYQILANFGYEKEALKLINQTTAPSLGHTFSLGATTLWERIPLNDEAAKLCKASLNHPMQGGFTAWFYQGLGGIELDPENPGFKHFFLKPQLTDELDFVEVEFNSIRGLISSMWKNEDNKFKWQIIIPVNCSATVYFPSDSMNRIFIDSKCIKELSDIELIEKAGNYCVFKLPSGEYNFERERSKR